MKHMLTLGLLFLLLALFPQLALVPLAGLGALALWAATQPVILAFAGGLLVERMRRWQP
ncbi:hypothetical protein ACFYOY_14060 [Streptomyces sp. NPDC007875]|uniref:hypothetical protein n=1 Tax=Streptomyces sp. NPDC007875 TaxID=3364783 RepID=UPI003689EBEA